MKSKYYEWNSGGGLLVLRKDTPRGFFLVTDQFTGDMPERGKPADLGFYTTKKFEGMIR